MVVTLEIRVEFEGEYDYKHFSEEMNEIWGQDHRALFFGNINILL